MFQTVQQYFAVVVAQGQKATVRREVQSVDDLHLLIVKLGEVLVDRQRRHVHLRKNRVAHTLHNFPRARARGCLLPILRPAAGDRS